MALRNFPKHAVSLHLPVGPQPSLLLRRLRSCFNTLLLCGCRSLHVYGPLVPDQRARLSEPITTDGAHEGLQANVLLVVDYKASALRERRVAGGAVWVHIVAPVVCHAGASAFHWDRYLLKGILGQDFETCVVYPCRRSHLGCPLHRLS